MNKATITYKKYWRLSIAAFLAVMLTLAPCSVRNSIEHSLGLKKTTVANKGKSAEIRSYACSAAEFQQNNIRNKANFLSFDADFAETSAISFIQKFTNLKHFSLTSYMGGAIKIPLYILYRSFKYHLSFI